MTRLFVVAFTLIWAVPSFANDDITLRATASPDRLPPGYSFRLEITVSGKGIRSLPDPRLPRLDSFEIKRRSSVQQGSMVGLSVTMSKTIAYEVVAPKEGKFKIPSITLLYRGKTYRTDPIDIIVEASAPIPSDQRRTRRKPAPAPPGVTDPFGSDRNNKRDNDDLMVTLDVDKKSAVPYEPIIATFSFYRAVDLWQNPSYDKPKFEGFWVEDLPYKKGENEQVTHEWIDGRSYIVTKLRYAIIPLAPGRKTIDPATIMVAAGPWSERVRLKTKPISINVRPFPEDGAPAGFSNIVGKYKISAQVAPVTAKINDAITLRLTIKGAGYLKPVGSPPKPSIDGMEVYDPKIIDSVDKSGGAIISTKIIEYPMIPREAGIKRVDSFSIWAYDPDLKKYILLTTPPIEVTVLPGKTDQTAGASVSGAITPPKSDILYIKPDKGVLNDFGSPLHSSWLVWVIFITPFPLLVAGSIVAQRKKKLSTDSVYSRSYHAAKTARSLLADAGNLKEPGEFYMALDIAVRGYLADKWNVSAPSITKELATNRLESSGVENVGALIELFEAVEIARYAQHETNNMSLHLAKANEFIEWMEKQTG